MAQRSKTLSAGSGAILALLLMLCEVAMAREIVYSLPTATETAEAIVAGSVRSEASDQVTISIDAVLKGSVAGSEQQIALVQVPMFRRRMSLDVGESFIFFLQSEGAGFGALPGRGSVVPYGAEMQAAVQGLLDYLATGSVESKTAILAGMLGGDNEAAQEAAVDVLLQKGRAADYLPLDLLPLVRPLVESASRSVASSAVQALVAIGDRSVIPNLIDALELQDPIVAELAYGLLVRVTSESFAFDPSLSPEERGPAIQQWRNWWAENRDTAPLILQ